MVQRNLTLPYEFVCFTENKKGIDKNIRIESLPDIPVEGWWYKPWLLSNELPFNGTILFFDLDVVIFQNIDKFFTHLPGKFLICRDFNRSLRGNWNRMNSSVFRTEVGQYHNLYKNFLKHSVSTVRRFHGDQDWMYKNINDHAFFPDEWIQSYKWEMRNRTDLIVENGKRKFKNKGVPKIKKDTSVAVFHGQPNPADCLDDWVVDNWQ
jgi:hypothetical protein